MDKIKATSAETAAVQKRFEAIETTPPGRAIQAKLAEVGTRYLAAREAMNKAGEGGGSRSPRPSPRARRRRRSTRWPTNTWA